MVCAGDAVCTGAVVAVSFGAGVEVAAGAFVLATGAAGSVRFGVCATGFGSVFTVACGFFGSITACWRAGRVVAGRSAVCVFAVSRDALPLRTGATVAGSVGNVELTATLFNCC